MIFPGRREFAAASIRVLQDDGPAALQYAASEGFAPLRERVAAVLPWPVDPEPVLITTGSQPPSLYPKLLLAAAIRDART